MPSKTLDLPEDWPPTCQGRKHETEMDGMNDFGGALSNDKLQNRCAEESSHNNTHNGLLNVSSLTYNNNLGQIELRVLADSTQDILELGCNGNQLIHVDFVLVFFVFRRGFVLDGLFILWSLCLFSIVAIAKCEVCRFAVPFEFNVSGSDGRAARSYNVVKFIGHIQKRSNK